MRWGHWLDESTTGGTENGWISALAEKKTWLGEWSRYDKNRCLYYRGRLRLTHRAGIGRNYDWERERCVVKRWCHESRFWPMIHSPASTLPGRTGALGKRVSTLYYRRLSATYELYLSILTSYPLHTFRIFGLFSPQEINKHKKNSWCANYFDNLVTLTVNLMPITRVVYSAAIPHICLEKVA